MLKTKQDFELGSKNLVETVATDMNLESRFVRARQTSQVDTAVATGTYECREIVSERLNIVPCVTSHTTGDRDRDRSSNRRGFVVVVVGG